MTTTPSNAPCKPLDAVTSRYSPVGGASTLDGNMVKLRAVVALFRLPLGDIAKTAGVSRPYVSRVMGGSLKPSPQFLRRLEANLHTLVERRHGQVFEVESTPVEAAELVLTATPLAH